MSDYIQYDEQGNKILKNRQQAWNETSQKMGVTTDITQKKNVMNEYLDSIHENFAYAGNKTQSVRYGSYSEYYSPISASKRTKTQKNEIAVKTKNALKIQSAEEIRQKKQQDRAKDACAATGYKISNPDLQAISVFMQNKTSANAELLRKMIGNNTTDENRAEALIICITRFLDACVSDKAVADDDKIASNAAKLENLSEKFGAVTYLITNFAETYAGLQDGIREDFEKKYARAKGIVYYYRLKKAVMTNDYYKSHANCEIGTKVKENDSLEKKTLTSLIWQAEGGMEAFLKKGEDYILDQTTVKLAAALEKDGVSNDRAALMKGIADRRKEIEKHGILKRKDRFSWENDNYLHDWEIVNDKKNEYTPHIELFEHVRKIEAVDLTGDPKKDLKKLTQLMDQLEIAEQSLKYRETRMGSYYLERSGKDIMISDALIESKEMIRSLQNDLLTIAGLNEYGSVDGTVSREAIEAARESYTDHLQDYRDAMQNIADLNNMDYTPGKLRSPDHYLTDKPGGEVEDAEVVKERTKALITRLASERFSDIELYNYRETIGELYVLCQDEKQKNVLKVALDRAIYVWTTKRIIDLEEATNNHPEKKDELMEKLMTIANLQLENGGQDDTIEPILKLRGEAEKLAYEYEDIKAVALYYNEQQEWMKTARETKLEKPGGMALIRAGKIFMTNPRTFDHGEIRYDESVEKMKKIPEDLTKISSENYKMQVGKKSLVPPVEISKYYADPDKKYLGELFEAAQKEIQKGTKVYPAEILTAVEAIGHYSKLQGLINGQTVEMEMAFLDKFKKSVSRYISQTAEANGSIRFDDPVIFNVLQMQNRIENFAGGTLRKEISRGVIDAVKEQQPIYIDQFAMSTITSPVKSFKARSKASNAADIPLFLHKPNLNDVKQGYTGDCYFLAAVTALIYEDPEAIMNMFHDLNDGTVIVRLFMPYDKDSRRVDSSNFNKDEVEFKPAYIRVRKDYETQGAYGLDCMWIQLLEKAYASTGTNHHIATVEKDGKLNDMEKEISDGDAEKVLMHLTGKKNYNATSMPSPLVTERVKEYSEAYAKKLLLYGVPLYLHKEIWNELSVGLEEGKSRDSFEDTVDELLVTVKNTVTRFNSGINKGVETIWDQLKRNNIDIDDATKQDIQNRIEKLYTNNPDEICRIMKTNLTSEGTYGNGRLMDPNASIKGQMEFGYLIDIVIAGLSKHMPVDEIFTDIQKETQEYYTERTKPENMTAKDYQREGNKIGIEALMKIQSVFEENPQDRYSTTEMGMLHQLRKAIQKKKAAAVLINGHVITGIDVKLYKNHWFVLIRDTHNIYNYNYSKEDEHGNLEGSLFRGTFELLAGKSFVQEIHEKPAAAFVGTSWWELKDLLKITYSVITGED